MTEGTKKLLIGIAVGAVATAFIQTDTFKKGAAKVLAGATQLKNDTKEFLASIKEDAEDVAAEKNA